MREVKIGLHNHFRTSSWVKERDLEKAAKIARERLGPGAVIGLVNFSDFRYEQTIERSPLKNKVDLGNAVYLPDYDVLVIKGQEIPTNQGHLLAMGVRHGWAITEHEDAETTLRRIKGLGILAIADHPFYHEGLGQFISDDIKARAPLFDGFEVYNGEAEFGFSRGPLPKDANRKASDFYFNEIYKKYPVFALSSSDGHSFGEIGNNPTTIKMPDNYRESFTREGRSITDTLKKGLLSEDVLFESQSLGGYLGGAKHVLELAAIIGNEKIAKSISNVPSPFRYLDRKFHGTSNR